MLRDCWMFCQPVTDAHIVFRSIQELGTRIMMMPLRLLHISCFQSIIFSPISSCSRGHILSVAMAIRRVRHMARGGRNDTLLSPGSAPQHSSACPETLSTNEQRWPSSFSSKMYIVNFYSSATDNHHCQRLRHCSRACLPTSLCTVHAENLVNTILKTIDGNFTQFWLQMYLCS